MKLYEIDERIEALIDEETGEIKDCKAFEKICLERDKKLEGIALWIKNLSSDAEELKAEKLKLAERQQATEKKIENLKNFLSHQLAGKKFSTPRVVCNFRASLSVEITDIDKIDKSYLIYEPKADKTALKTVLKNGEEVAGAHLVSKLNLQVK